MLSIINIYLLREVSAAVWRMAGAGPVLPRQPKMLLHLQTPPPLHCPMKNSHQPLEEQPGERRERERERERNDNTIEGEEKVTTLINNYIFRLIKNSKL